MSLTWVDQVGIIQNLVLLHSFKMIMAKVLFEDGFGTLIPEGYFPLQNGMTHMYLM